jgi:hypothetical protein
MPRKQTPEFLTPAGAGGSFALRSIRVGRGFFRIRFFLQFEDVRHAGIATPRNLGTPLKLLYGSCEAFVAMGHPHVWLKLWPCLDGIHTTYSPL